MPEEQIALTNGTVLQRNVVGDGPMIAQAVRESYVHLQPWLPWVVEAAKTDEAQSRRASEMEQAWGAGTDYVWVLRLADSSDVIGMFGLHRRIGPDAIELGYWIHVGYTHRGYATAAAAAAVREGLAAPQVARVELHTDEANRFSAAVPRRLGLRLDRIEPRHPQASGESGRLQIWTT